jgi:hypothetical protein
MIQESREQLSQTIDKMFKVEKDSDAKERCRITDELINRYIERTGETPPPILLDRLAGFILKADKTKKNRHDSEYKVLSHRQTKIRQNREVNIMLLLSYFVQRLTVQNVFNLTENLTKGYVSAIMDKCLTG